MFGTSWQGVSEAVRMAVEWGLNHREMTRITAIGIEEIAWRKVHKYVTLVYQLNEECKRLLYVGQNRSDESLRGFLQRSPAGATLSEGVAGFRHKTLPGNALQLPQRIDHLHGPVKRIAPAFSPPNQSPVFASSGKVPKSQAQKAGSRDFFRLLHTARVQPERVGRCRGLARKTHAREMRRSDMDWLHGLRQEVPSVRANPASRSRSPPDEMERESAPEWANHDLARQSWLIRREPALADGVR